MAVTGFWPIYKNLKATLDYADNPDKTTAREYLDDDLYAALSYAENDNKTDRKMYVGGINCSKQNAYAEMVAVQRRFGLRGKVVGYHGIQSFREGEVTPEQAFEIGMETARRMWCDKYQVFVTVHLNTDNVHCHFVVNPVSFKDGTKFQNKIGDHKELRRVSDEISIAQLLADSGHLIPVRRDDADALEILSMQHGKHLLPDDVDLSLVEMPAGVIACRCPVYSQHIRLTVIFCHHDQLPVVELLVAEVDDLWVATVMFTQQCNRCILPYFPCRGQQAVGRKAITLIQSILLPNGITGTDILRCQHVGELF